MTVGAAAFTREALATLPCRTLSKPGAFRADVRLYESGGRRFVVKDFAGRAAPVRATLGRWFTGREGRVLERLAGIPAVPRFLGRIDALAFAMEFVEGEPMGRAAGRRLDARFFAALEEAIAAMHGRRIVHNDLRQRKNLLVAPDGLPRIVDFAGALDFSRLGAPGRLLQRAFAHADRSAVRKFKARYAPSLLSAAESAAIRRDERWRRLWPFDWLSKAVRGRKWG